MDQGFQGENLTCIARPYGTKRTLITVKRINNIIASLFQISHHMAYGYVKTWKEFAFRCNPQT
jgi:hypothetical protein